MMISIYCLLIFTIQVHSGVIPKFISPNNSNGTAMNENQSLISSVDENQFAETVVDLLLELLNKANLSHTISIIHNDTDLTEFNEQHNYHVRKLDAVQLPLR